MTFAFRLSESMKVKLIVFFDSFTADVLLKLAELQTVCCLNPIEHKGIRLSITKQRHQEASL